MKKIKRVDQTLQLEGEIWKDIPKYEGLYQASNFGRIKSLSRVVLSDGKFRGLKKERILTPRLNTGYLRVPMQRNVNDKGKQAVHRMIASAFLGESHLTVDHIDGDKTNNRIENLRYVSHAENVYTSFNSKSKYGCAGIDFSKKKQKFRARISKDGTVIDLGCYTLLEHAIAVRKDAEKRFDFFKTPADPHPHKTEMSIKYKQSQLS